MDKEEKIEEKNVETIYSFYRPWIEKQTQIETEKFYVYIIRIIRNVDIPKINS